ncbi:FitA-like ribbon-helix-helix domain-containing protein [Salinarimonas sp. NSM]|uniref:FitA-like ribbon-helix-helix domain-containing protein n=1 Tax=Salinarimonas sp. NSM TaxID=3458003 RepID=UPI004036D5BB
MVDILVRNVDDELAARLKDRARAQGTSLNEVAREALQAFARPSQAEFLEIADRIASMGPRFPGSSVDLIREDRDNDEPYR